jgi:hypothetical protein
MRLTVGPLPPAVYWRRRALVLGGLLVVIILLVYTCSDPESDAKSSGASATRTAGATTGAPPGAGGAAAAHRSLSPSASASPSSPAPATTPPDRSFCTDDELRVTPVPAARRLARGTQIKITLKIKNISSRTCKRDVGPDQQELYIVEQGGAQKVWSSDDCGGPRGTSVEPFSPGFERAYTATWNGRESANCKDKPLPPAGTYQLYGRLGTKRSDPVTLTLR